MSLSFKGKKVLVTGAGRGIGKDLVITLAKDGAVVYALSKNVDNLKTLEKECPGVITIPCDLSDWSATEKAIAGLEAVDHLVNNADTFNVNVKSIINVTKIVTNKMIAAGKKGSVVNVSSVSAIKPAVGLMVYCATKASVDMLTKCMAMELAPHKIRVNSVNPTIIVTDMGNDLWRDKLEECRKNLPLGEFPSTNHCSNAIMYLLSDLSEFTTGSTLMVDSGVILVIVMLALSYHAFYEDVAWNKRVEEHGSNICIKINNEIENETQFQESICPQRSQLILQNNCDIVKYRMESPTPKQYWDLIKDNMMRTQASQNTYLAMMTITAVLLVIHMIVANISKNLEMRTKWNAAMQGVILFGSGFALMLLAISLNAMDLKYQTLLGAVELPECKLLMWCSKPTDSQPKQQKIAVERALEAHGACQEYALKHWSCILLGLLIAVCLAMILMAMELTTKYEEEEEKEAIDKNARGEMAVLLQDENVVFETDIGVSDELIPGQRSSKNSRFHHRRSIAHDTGSHVLQEYLLREKQHHHEHES
ncbi:D-erythrulose reductase [Orchesella cincta]|uniref:D-erythrulose reductase n=1 Tax=Orchesella cincta TaxID=48709 RepID=A0A1D2MFX8_ORCCI|nr:D-erythrulose reductase [Orchesella cincta]